MCLSRAVGFCLRLYVFEDIDSAGGGVGSCGVVAPSIGVGIGSFRVAVASERAELASDGVTVASERVDR